MPRTLIPEYLLEAYRQETSRLLSLAKELQVADPGAAADHIHRARNLEAVVLGYERLAAKRAQDQGAKQ